MKYSQIELQYGKNQTIKVEIPYKNLYYVKGPGVKPSLEDPTQAVCEAIRNPVGCSSLSTLAKRGDKVVLLADDNTRPTPQNIILPVVLDELNRTGIPDRDMEIIIASGTHRSMDEREIREKFGDKILERVSIVRHDFRDEKGLVRMGRTELGTPVSVSKRVCDADVVIGSGNIVPHEMFGWGGGGKIIQPGVCGEDTTDTTHINASKLVLESGVFKAGQMEQESRKEIDTVAAKAGLKFIVNTILNHESKICKVVAGDPLKAHREGVETARSVYRPRIPGYADILVTTSYPADIDYWQAEKPHVYSLYGTKRGGTVVFLTPCPEGISPVHGAVLSEKLRQGDKENWDVVKKERADEETLMSIFAITIRLLLKHADVICVSDMCQEDKEGLGFKHADTVEEALEMAFKRQGRDAKIGVLTSGEIVPRAHSSDVGLTIN